MLMLPFKSGECRLEQSSPVHVFTLVSGLIKNKRAQENLTQARPQHPEADSNHRPYYLFSVWNQVSRELGLYLMEVSQLYQG